MEWKVLCLVQLWRRPRLVLTILQVEQRSFLFHCTVYYGNRSCMVPTYMKLSVQLISRVIPPYLPLGSLYISSYKMQKCAMDTIHLKLHKRQWKVVWKPLNGQVYPLSEGAWCCHGSKSHCGQVQASKVSCLSLLAGSLVCFDPGCLMACGCSVVVGVWAAV